MSKIIYNVSPEIKYGDVIAKSTHYGEEKHTVILVEKNCVATKSLRHEGEKIITLWEHECYETITKETDWSNVDLSKKMSEEPFKLVKKTTSNLEENYWGVVDENMDDVAAVKFITAEMIKPLTADRGLIQGASESIRNS